MIVIKNIRDKNSLLGHNVEIIIAKYLKKAMESRYNKSKTTGDFEVV